MLLTILAILNLGSGVTHHLWGNNKTALANFFAAGVCLGVTSGGVV